MRKNLLLFTALLIFNNSEAQNTFPASGNVGIGTTSPQFKLHVIGDIGIDQPHAVIFANGQSIRDNGGGGLTISSGYSISNYLSGTGLGSYTIMGGNVGIGTTNPGTKLSVSYSNNSTTINSVTDGVAFQNTSSVNGALNTLFFSNPGGFASAAISVSQTNAGNNGDNLILQTKANAGVWNLSQLVLNTSGNVGIGTTSPDQKLTVNGTIHSTQVRVDLNVPGPDYVFKKNYSLPELTEVKNYIDRNHHLSEIPSADQMAKNGVDLGNMNIMLLKKVEELTLYLIEKDSEIKDLKKQFATFKKQRRIMK